MSEDVVSAVIALDSRAEELISRARDEAAKIRCETAGRIEEAHATIAAATKEEIAKIEAEAASEREAEIKKVRDEFRARADTIRNAPAETVEEAVRTVIARVMGSSQ